MSRLFSQHDSLMGRVLLKIHLNIYFKVTPVNKYMYMYGEQSFVNFLVYIKFSMLWAHTADHLTIQIFGLREHSNIYL